MHDTPPVPPRRVTRGHAAIGLDLGTAREKVRVANALGQLPKIDEALRVGKLSYAKVRALTRVATAANEAKLLDLALAATGAQLERICRGYRSAMNQDRPCVPEDRSVRTRLLPGGMVKLSLSISRRSPKPLLTS